MPSASEMSAWLPFMPIFETLCGPNGVNEPGGGVEKPFTLPSISESVRRNSFFRLETALFRDGTGGFVSGPGVLSRPAG